MSQEAQVEFMRLLSNLQPAWILIILVGMILAYRSPRLVKELFAGVRALLITRREKESKKSRKTEGVAVIEPSKEQRA